MSRLESMMSNRLAPEVLGRLDACWRAANYLSVGPIYLRDDPPLKRPLVPYDVKHMLLGHRGTTPSRRTLTGQQVTSTMVEPGPPARVPASKTMST